MMRWPERLTAFDMTHSLDRLSDHERDLLTLLAQGHTAKTIARSRSLSVNTVNEHLRSARRKTHASSSRELARLLVATTEPSFQKTCDKQFGVEDPAVAVAETSRQGGATGAEKTRTIWRTAMILAVLTAAGFLAYQTSAPNQADRALPPTHDQAATAQAVRPDMTYQVLFKVNDELVAAPTVLGQFGREVRVELPNRMQAVMSTTAPDHEGLSLTSAKLSVFENGSWRTVKEMSMTTPMTSTPSFELSVDDTPYRFVVMPRRIVPAAD